MAIQDVKTAQLAVSIRLNLLLVMMLGLALGALYDMLETIDRKNVEISQLSIQPIVRPIDRKRDLNNQCVIWLFEGNMKAAKERVCRK